MKFRIYDSKQKRMISHSELFNLDCSNELPFLPLVNGFYNTVAFEDNKPHEYHPMIGLDLTDYQKTEIYTGDIIGIPLTDDFLKSSTSVLAQVATEQNADRAILIIHPALRHGNLITSTYLQKNGQYIPEKDSDEPKCFGQSYDSMFLMFLLAKNASVIGNVYENPELTKNIEIQDSLT